MIKKVTEKTIAVFFTLFLCLIILEAGLRIIGRTPSIMTDGIFEQFGSSYRLKKNIRIVTKWPSFSYITYTNSYGFRDKENNDKKIDEKSYFVFLGPSSVFGNGVNYENSFVGVFAEKVSIFNIDVLNIGIGGHHFIDQELLFFDFINNIEKKPSKVFVCFNSAFMSNFDKKHENLIVKNGFLFDKRSWKIAYMKLFLGNSFSSYCFFRDNFRKLQANLTQNDKNFRNSTISIYSKDSYLHNSENIKKFKSCLIKFENICKMHEIIPVYVYLPLIDNLRLNEMLVKLNENPQNYDVYYYEKLLRDYCINGGISYISFRNELKKYYDKKIQLTFQFDPHYNEYANRIIGEYLFEMVFSE